MSANRNSVFANYANDIFFFLSLKHKFLTQIPKEIFPYHKNILQIAEMLIYKSVVKRSMMFKEGMGVKDHERRFNVHLFLLR